MDDLISRQAAIDIVQGYAERLQGYIGMPNDSEVYAYARGLLLSIDRNIKALPPAHPETHEKRTETHSCDCISRKDAIDAIEKNAYRHTYLDQIIDIIKALPSAQPERTCVNCGRTANNGGWYADGRTRCPIEEHYALPKDGYCHLWERRNVTDDNYPERRTDGRD